MRISEQDVQHLATLSRIKLTEEELQKFPQQLDDILSFVQTINEAELGDATTRDMTNHNTMRKDVIRDVQEQQTIVAGFPQSDGDLLSVPKIL